MTEGGKPDELGNSPDIKDTSTGEPSEPSSDSGSGDDDERKSAPQEENPAEPAESLPSANTDQNVEANSSTPTYFEQLKSLAQKGATVTKEYVQAEVEYAKEHPKTTIVVICVSAASPTIALCAIRAVGFQVGGVAAGSAATVIQSKVYGAWTRGTFSVCQRVGVKGFSSAASTGIRAATAVVAENVASWTGQEPEQVPAGA